MKRTRGIFYSFTIYLHILIFFHNLRLFQPYQAIIIVLDIPQDFMVTLYCRKHHILELRDVEKASW